MTSLCIVLKRHAWRVWYRGVRPFTGLCDEQVRKFLRVWCAPLGEADFVSQVGLRRVNRAVVVLVFPDSYSATFTRDVRNRHSLQSTRDA